MSATEKQPFRASVALAGAVAILLSLFAGYAGALSIGLGACGGDGGASYAADGSPRDRFCDSSGDTLQTIELVGVPVITLIASALAFARRRFTPLAIGVGLAALAFVGPLAVLSALAGDCAETYYESSECARYR